ncbi:MAG TPA: aspartate dehydrogenase [Pararhodobacter sp.]|uniref:aspartate dehydrogenase n=1 Tax=Pararhodobacter sp. TaxID=2127056 RepID=UPI002D15B545|nr:aspartate dehydrogenase [Pararhodobacter sp.]HPD92003.1 aspartate dehydrogenase [Pararhodobacter sp.]
MNIGLIGEGAIGRHVQAELAKRGLVPVAWIVRPAKAQAGGPRVASARDLPEHVTLMIDCAGHAALAEHGPAILARGIDLLTVSPGALADPVLCDRLEQAATAGGSRLYLASGAIGALDCLQAARIGELAQVRYTGRKPPRGWMGSPAETVLDLATLDQAATHFTGTAREAALRYPKNANVAAAVALAGIGFDRTEVALIADPAVTANVHEITASGTFGRFTFHIEAASLPDNPKSSAIAAMSVVAAIERQRGWISL